MVEKMIFALPFAMAKVIANTENENENENTSEYNI